MGLATCWRVYYGDFGTITAADADSRCWHFSFAMSTFTLHCSAMILTAPASIKAERDMERLLSVNVGLPRDIWLDTQLMTKPTLPFTPLLPSMNFGTVQHGNLIPSYFHSSHRPRRSSAHRPLVPVSD